MIDVLKEADFEAHVDAVARVVGVYRQLDLRMKQLPPPVHRGHALVQLDDGFVISLERYDRPAAIRSPDEIARCEGRRVAVVGRILRPFNDPRVATLLIASIREIASVELL